MASDEVLGVLCEIRDELRATREIRERKFQIWQDRQERLSAGADERHRRLYREVWLWTVGGVVGAFVFAVGANIAAQWIVTKL